MRRPTRREWVLIALVPALILLAAGAERDEGAKRDIPAPPRPKLEAHAEKERVVQTAELDLGQLHRAATGEPGKLFESKSWYVPPPPPPPRPPAPPPPPPVPQAPPLPFTFLGRYQDSDKPVILLVKQDRIYTVKAGDVIENTYRVDGIAGTTLGLTYLPLKIKQTINIGPAG